MISLPNAFDVFHSKTAALENSAKLEIRLRTGNRMNNPFHFRETVQSRISLGERCHRHQHTFAAALDLRKFDRQPVSSALEAPQDNR